jgi:hypothetical protein
MPWWIVGQACCVALPAGSIAAGLWHELSIVCVTLALVAEGALDWPIFRWLWRRLGRRPHEGH